MWLTGSRLSPAVYGMQHWNRDKPERFVLKDFRKMGREIRAVCAGLTTMQKLIGILPISKVLQEFQRKRADLILQIV